MIVKQGFPEESELVLCTVTNVQSHSVFVKVDEYEKNGLIHISEISPGRIRNIRDFVKEGKVIVCKVLKINKERGYIDLSLRRVTEAQRRAKADSLKAQQKAEKILEMVCKEHKKDKDKILEEIKPIVLQNYDNLYQFFEACTKDESLLETLHLDKKVAASLIDAVSQRIKPEIISVSGVLHLKSYKPDGIELIKNVLKKVQDVDKEIKIQYFGAGKFQLLVQGIDYKVIEKILTKAVDTAAVSMKKADSFSSFERKEA